MSSSQNEVLVQDGTSTGVTEGQEGRETELQGNLVRELAGSGILTVGYATTESLWFGTDG